MSTSSFIYLIIYLSDTDRSPFWIRYMKDVRNIIHVRMSCYNCDVLLTPGRRVSAPEPSALNQEK